MIEAPSGVIYSLCVCVSIVRFYFTDMSSLRDSPSFASFCYRYCIPTGFLQMWLPFPTDIASLQDFLELWLPFSTDIASLRDFIHLSVSPFSKKKTFKVFGNLEGLVISIPENAARTAKGDRRRKLGNPSAGNPKRKEWITPPPLPLPQLYFPHSRQSERFSHVSLTI